jgi:hypothetical protein
MILTASRASSAPSESKQLEKNTSADDRISSEPAISRHDVPSGARRRSLPENTISTQIYEDMHPVDLHLVTRGTLGPPPLFSQATRGDDNPAHHCSVNGVVMPAPDPYITSWLNPDGPDLG